jgi:hypothetical protein
MNKLTCTLTVTLAAVLAVPAFAAVIFAVTATIGVTFLGWMA